MTYLLCAIFFLSGVAALLFETLWFQQAGLVLGNSIWASSLVMAGFMGGLALGNGLAARVGPRVARPVRLYALLELAIAATGLALVHGLPLLTPWMARLLFPVIDQVWLAHLVRLGLALLLLLVPSTAMGATLPLLVKEMYGRDASFGRVLGRLYGWNTLGAVVGASLGHVLMTSSLGVRGAGACAAAANVLAALGAAWLGRRSPASAHVTTGEPRARVSARARWLLGAACVSGAIMLALEIVWFRFVVMFVHGTSLAFSMMLAVVLAGIGVGGLIAGAVLGRRKDLDQAVPLLACLGGLGVVSTYLGFGFVEATLGTWGIAPAVETLLLSSALMLPNALLSGVLFTALGHALQRALSGEIRPAGLLTLANTLGAMLGSLVGGFVLLPVLGVEASIQVLATLYLAVAGFAALGGLSRGPVAAIAAGGVLLLATIFGPPGTMQAHVDKLLAPHVARGSTPIAIREGLTETSMLLEDRRFGQVVSHKLLTNSFAMSTTNLHARRYMKLFVYLPVALHPDPQRALLISYGVGATAQALVETESVEHIDVVDTSRDILDLSSTIHSGAGRDPLHDPRVEVHIEDGRHFLQTRRARYDLITGEPPPPKIAGIVSLFTRETFEAIYDRLEEGGIVTYWLPVHGLLESETKAILRAFCDVFRDCSLWNGAPLDWIMMGTRDFEGRVPRDRFERQWRAPRVAPELEELGIERPEQLGALFMEDAASLRERTRDTPPLVDDHPGRLGSRVIGPRAAQAIYREWIDARAARERFEDSEAIAGLWPGDLKRDTLRFFDWQRVAVDFLSRRPRGVAGALRVFDRIQRETNLRTLPLWVLGSTLGAQRQLAQAERAGWPAAALDAQRGVGAVVEGNDEDAIEAFESADRSALGWHLAIYARCRLDRDDEALQMLGRTPTAFRDPSAARFLRGVCRR